MSTTAPLHPPEASHSLTVDTCAQDGRSRALANIPTGTCPSSTTPTWSVSDYRSRDKVASSDVRGLRPARRTTCLWIKESERSSPNARGSQTSYLSTYRLPRVSVTFGKEEAKEVEHPSPNVRSWDSSKCWKFSST